ncbi:MAG: class I SAM-dependent methyltransferase [Burkholderiales bacterium]
MRYFENHEAIYARRLRAGADGWDDGAYDDFALREVVLSWLATSSAAKPGAKILELGCGTGALSCMLAKQGFQVTGVDISSSAISFARSIASKRALGVAFTVADVCALEFTDAGFDLVIDSHLLHCIALPLERRQLLSRISRLLASDGEFWTETMALQEGFQESPGRRIDRAGTVWTTVESPNLCSDAVMEGGSWWIPMRYISPTAEALLEEFAAAGLKPIEWSLVPSSVPGEMADFRTRLARCAL